MSSVASRRVDPRALLRSARGTEGKASARLVSRGTGLSILALVGLGAFGAVVVKAQEDAGVLAFVRQQSRTITESRPTFFPSGWGRSVQRQPQAVAIAYAPSAPLPTHVPLTPDVRTLQPFHPTAESRPARRAAKFVPGPPVEYRGSGVAYCVRTCDGFFFPLGPSTGSNAGDEAACSQLCPATETRVYTRRIGEEMDVARARKDGSTYASLPAAFTHRNSYKAACSCTGKGDGLATGYSVRYDQTLRVGDAVMTAKGVRVFTGGAKVPYREASFTTLNRSDSVDKVTRETLRRLEQASIPNGSGLGQKPLTARSASLPKQVASAATASDAQAAIRDVAPGIARRP